MNRLAVVIYTYNRLDYARATVKAFMKLARNAGPTVFHIADDGSPDGYVHELGRTIFELRESFDGLVVDISATNAERRGYGASYNLAMESTHPRADLVLALEDDWELLRELDLARLGNVLFDEALAGERIGAIRLGYLGFTQELRGHLIYSQNQHFLILDPDSAERHVFAGHPRLETVAYQRAVGAWPEGLAAGSTEFEVAGRLEARTGVAWPLDIKPYGDLFAHIGTIQARSD